MKVSKKGKNMAIRKIIKIDEDKCNGCGLCIPNCHEGALQIIDGKVRLISDLFCDGLGACVGHCPQGAITIVERDAVPYDEVKVLTENIIPKGKNTLNAHILHLKEHDAAEYLNQALAFLKENGFENPLEDKTPKSQKFCGCPGSKVVDFSDVKLSNVDYGEMPSMLRQWPVQFHLINPGAPFYKGKDVVLSADCVAYSFGDFHDKFLKGKSLIIACPKLDSDQEIYLDKLVSLIDDAKINTLTVIIMEVPCCGGLFNIAEHALANAKRKIPVKKIVIGIKGEIIQENWI